MNGDGLPDAATNEHRPEQLRVLAGDGTGRLEVGTVIGLSILANEIELVDVNRDGLDDVLLVGYPADRLMVFPSDGGGGLLLPTIYDVAGSPQDIAVGDLDLDGYADVAVACYGNAAAGTPSGVAIWHGSAGGALTRYQLVAPAITAYRVAIADVDLDGRTDLFVSSPQTASVRLGNGSGGFDPAVELPYIPPYTVTDVLATDLEGSLGPELLVTWRHFYGGAVSVFGGSVADGFVEIRRVATGPSPAGAMVSDVDRNGSLDIVIAHESGVTTVLADGSGDFAIVDGRGAFAISASLADVDPDGYPDIVLPWAAVPNRCHEARRGTVNSAGGGIVDVLRVNGSAGERRERTLTLATANPVRVTMDSPPSRAGRSPPFCLYAWDARPGAGNLPAGNPGGAGRFVLPVPLLPGSPQPVFTWNNFPGPAARMALGDPDRASEPAPSVVFGRGRGIGRPATIFLQGLIRDDAGPNGRAAVTNAIQLVVLP